MVQLGGEARLVEEHRGRGGIVDQRRQRSLERDPTLEAPGAELPRQEDLGHPAKTQAALDAVATEGAAVVGRALEHDADLTRDGRQEGQIGGVEACSGALAPHCEEARDDAMRDDRGAQRQTMRPQLGRHLGRQRRRCESADAPRQPRCQGTAKLPFARDRAARAAGRHATHVAADEAAIVVHCPQLDQIGAEHADGVDRELQGGLAGGALRTARQVRERFGRALWVELLSREPTIDAPLELPEERLAREHRQRGEDDLRLRGQPRQPSTEDERRSDAEPDEQQAHQSECQGIANHQRREAVAEQDVVAHQREGRHRDEQQDGKGVPVHHVAGRAEAKDLAHQVPHRRDGEAERHGEDHQPVLGQRVDRAAALLSSIEQQHDHRHRDGREADEHVDDHPEPSEEP